MAKRKYQKNNFKIFEQKTFFVNILETSIGCLFFVFL